MLLAERHQQVKGIVLAGVHSWDGSLFDRVLPRPLVPVAHSPLICYVLGWLRDGGIRTATICANSASRAVRALLGDGTRVGVQIDYYEDWTPRGPAGCVRDAAMGSDAETFVVADGTIIPQLDLDRLLAAHDEAGAAVTVAACRDGENGNGRNGHLTPTGVYVFARRALDYVSKMGYQDIKEVLIPQLRRHGECVVTHRVGNPCPRVTCAGTYLAANEWVLERLLADPHPWPGYREMKEGRVHQSVSLGAGVMLVGPVLVGPETRIERNATIVGPTVIGAGCTIREGAVVCRSAIWDACLVGRTSRLDQCILVHGASVRAGARLSDVVYGQEREKSAGLLGRFRRKRPERGAAGSGGLVGEQESRCAEDSCGRLPQPERKV